MSGSATVNGTTYTAIPGSSTDGPFLPYEVPTAQKVNYYLIYGDKLGGSIDNCPIGVTTPTAGNFTTLTCATPTAGDVSNAAATTAFVNAAVAAGGGGGSTVTTLNNATLTGVPTTPTPAASDVSNQIANTSFVANQIALLTAAKYAGNGAGPGVFRDDGTGAMSTINAYFYPSQIVTAPTTNMQFKWRAPSPCSILGMYVEAPGAGAAGSNNFAITASKTSAGATSAIGATFTGSASTITVQTCTQVNLLAGDSVTWTVGVITGTIPVINVQLVGNNL